MYYLCHGTGVASHREVRVTIVLDLLCSGIITPFYTRGRRILIAGGFKIDFIFPNF